MKNKLNKNKLYNILSRQEGEGRAKIIIFVSLIALVLYAASVAGPPFMAKMNISKEIKEFVRDNYDEKIAFFKDNVFNKVKKIKPDIKEDEVIIESNNGKITVTVKYTENLVFIKEHLEYDWEITIEKSTK